MKNIRYDRGDYFVRGTPGFDVIIAVMCGPGIDGPKRVTLKWDKYLEALEAKDDLGIGLDARVWRDIDKGMHGKPLETRKYNPARLKKLLMNIKS